MDLLVRGRQIPHSASDRQGRDSHFSCHAFTWNRWTVVLQMQGVIEHPPAYASPSQSEERVRRRLFGTQRLVADMDPSDHACKGTSLSLQTFAGSDSQREGNG